MRTEELWLTNTVSSCKLKRDLFFRNLENCGQIASGWPNITAAASNNFDWNDADCKSHSNYICENQSGPCT